MQVRSGEDFIFKLYLATDEELRAGSLQGYHADPSELVPHARHNKIAPYLHLQMKKIGHPMAPLLEDEYAHAESRNLEQLQMAMPIFKELRERNIDVIILKGYAMAEDVFGSIGYKPLYDIDILLKDEDLSTAYEIFQSHGLMSAGTPAKNVFFSKDLHCLIGIHLNLAPSGRGLTMPVEKFWEEKEEFTLRGEKFYRLSPAHFLLHLCVSLNPVKTGLREVGDIAKWIQYSRQKLSMDVFLSLVFQSNGQHEVFEALAYVNALNDDPFVRPALKELSTVLSKIFVGKVFDRCRPSRKILYSRSNYVSKIRKTFALFQLTEAPLEKTTLLMRIVKMILFVPRIEAYRLGNILPEDEGLSRSLALLEAPFTVGEYLARDLDFRSAVLRAFKPFWDLAEAYVQYFKSKIRSEPVRDLQAIADEMGLDPLRLYETAILD